MMNTLNGLNTTTLSDWVASATWRTLRLTDALRFYEIFNVTERYKRFSNATFLARTEAKGVNAHDLMWFSHIRNTMLKEILL